MTQIGYPVVNEELTDAIWRYLHGHENGIVNNYDGSAYGIVLSTNSDVATLGSTTEDSTARVAGFGHRIPRNEQHGVTINPVTTGSQRTDIIALRYDPTYTGAPGPVRLVVVEGAPGDTGLPVMDTTPPGLQDEPLWAVTRRSNTALSQATLVSLRRWKTDRLWLAAGTPLPETAPLGTLLTIGTAPYLRVLNGATPGWHAYPNDLVERLETLTRRTPHAEAPWGSMSGYGPWWVYDGSWNVAPGSAIKSGPCYAGHTYMVSATFTTVVAHQSPGILVRLGLGVSTAAPFSTPPTARPGAGLSVLTQQTGIVSGSAAGEETMPTTLSKRWRCPEDGDYWFYPLFATNHANGVAIRNHFGSPFTEVTDLGPMTSRILSQAP